MFRLYHRSICKFLRFFGLPCSAAMATVSNNSSHQLLEKVVGYDNRKDDLILFPNTTRPSSNSIVYYFGGDIQVVQQLYLSERGK